MQTIFEVIGVTKMAPSNTNETMTTTCSKTEGKDSVMTLCHESSQRAMRVRASSLLEEGTKVLSRGILWSGRHLGSIEQESGGHALLVANDVSMAIAQQACRVH